MESMEARFSARRCPKCGAALLTDGRRFWCSYVGNGRGGPGIDSRACDYHAESETELDQYNPGKPPPAEALPILTMTLSCEGGHVQCIRFEGLTREYVEGMAGLLDGTSDMFVYPPGPESRIGKCAACGAKITAKVE